MENTCKPMAVSFQCMTKFTTNKKKKADTHVKNEEDHQANISANKLTFELKVQTKFSKRKKKKHHILDKI